MAKKNLQLVDAVDDNYKLVRDADGTDTSLEVANDKLKVNGDLDVTSNLSADGNLKVSNGDLTIDSGKKIYLDAGSDTYITESGTDILRFVVGGETLMILAEAGGGASDKVAIPATTPLFFDGGTETYIAETSADILEFFVGGVKLLKLVENGGGASDSVAITPTTPLYLGVDTYITEASADRLELVVGGDEMLILDEDDQRVTIEADKLVYKIGSGGDEYSVAGSAYAGTILGYRCLGHDAGRIMYTMTASFVTLHANATVRFVAPPSGVVEVYVQAGLIDSYSNRYIYFGLSDNAVYNTLGAEHEEMVHMADESDQQIIQNTWVISGLTAGDTYNYWFGVKVSSAVGGNSYLNYGGTGSGHYPPFIMKVTALPAATADFAVYD